MIYPFTKSFAETIYNWARDPDYRRFFASNTNIPTMEDCEHFDKYSGCEILFYHDSSLVCGMAAVKENPYDVY